MMPGRSRIDPAGDLHHVIVRDTERGAVFRSDTDWDYFVERLAEVLEDTKAKGYPIPSS
jgi:hypothetical protein